MRMTSTGSKSTTMTSAVLEDLLSRHSLPLMQNQKYRCSKRSSQLWIHKKWRRFTIFLRKTCPRAERCLSSRLSERQNLLTLLAQLEQLQEEEGSVAEAEKEFRVQERPSLRQSQNLHLKQNGHSLQVQKGSSNNFN